MKTTSEILFILIRNALFDNNIDSETIALASQKMNSLYEMAKKYDVTYLLSYAFDKSKISIDDEDLKKKINKGRFVSVVRYERIVHDFNEVKSAFEEEKIDFIPLKGSVIRDLYPEPWMRSSCDIDILIRENDLNKAVKVLREKCFYTGDNQRDFHDVSLFSEGGTHLELHFNIMENMKDVDVVLSKVWQYAKPSNEGSCMYELETEFLIYHILAHMSYHVLNGGCGIRSFIDLYLLEKKLKYNENILCDLCRQGGILDFKTESEKLASVWMENKEHDNVTKMFEEFILDGGVYGSLETASAIKHVTTGSKAKYILTRIFQPYAIIKEKYPVLKKHKWLLPVCQVRRWIYILTSDRKNLAPSIFKAGGNLSKEQVEKKLQLLKNVGLDDK